MSTTNAPVQVMRGTVIWFHNGKGYGYIAGEDGIDRYVHFSKIVSDAKFKSLKKDQHVEFVPFEGAKGPAASQVKVV